MCLSGDISKAYSEYLSSVCLVEIKYLSQGVNINMSWTGKTGGVYMCKHIDIT